MMWDQHKGTKPRSEPRGGMRDLSIQGLVTAETLFDLLHQLRGRRQIQRALRLLEGFPNRSYGLATDAIEIFYVFFKSLGTPCQTTKGFAGFELNEIEKKE